MISYAKQSISKEDIDAVKSVFEGAWLTQGPFVDEFEKGLCAYTGAKYCVTVSSGTAALHLSMLAIGLKPGEYIITSPITFAASANAALYVGADVRFVDVDEKTIHIDLDKLEDYLSNADKLPKAIVPVHFTGTVVDMKKLHSICQRFGVHIIEDAAHAIGASYTDKDKTYKVGSCAHSDMTIFSFHPIKNMTCAEGGAVMTNDRDLYDNLKKLRHHGIERDSNKATHYDIDTLGFNYRLSDLHAALGVSQLKRLDSFIDKRKQLVSAYKDELSGVDGISLLTEADFSNGAYHLFVTRVKKGMRDKMHEFLKDNGVLTQVNYLPVHLMSLYKSRFGFKVGDFDVAEQYSKECLSLPLFADLSVEELEEVVFTVKRFFCEESRTD